MRNKPIITVLIPVYNEERNIARVIAQIEEALKEIEHLILVVDDNSKDMTAEIARELGADIVFNDRRRGYGNALTRGLEFCESDIIVTLDGDGQHDPKDIPKLIKPILEDSADIVIGSRFLEEGTIRPGAMGISGKIAIKFMNLMLRHFLDPGLSDTQSGFRALSKEVIKEINLEEKDFVVSTELLLKARERRFRIAEIPITYRPRENIKYSSFSFLRHGFGILKMIIRNFMRF